MEHHLVGHHRRLVGPGPARPALGYATAAKTAPEVSPAASWIQMILDCVTTQRNMWDGVTNQWTWNSI